ncbi:hypothetical protein KI387_002542, partial [Taxus chinensis]
SLRSKSVSKFGAIDFLLHSRAFREIPSIPSLDLDGKLEKNLERLNSGYTRQ